LKLDRERVREGREQLALSIEDASTKARVSPHTWIRAERGEEVRPSSVRRIADALGVAPAELREEPVPLGEAPEEAVGRTSGEERLIIEGMLEPWIRWFKRDAEHLERLQRAQKVDEDADEKIRSDRRHAVEALDGVGDALEALGIDWNDRRNPAMRRALYDLQRAFMGWQHISLVVSAPHYADNPDAYDEEARRTTPRMLRDAA
jgi:transcriptional regulator with XRE-family HTH domain